MQQYKAIHHLCYAYSGWIRIQKKYMPCKRKHLTTLREIMDVKDYYFQGIIFKNGTGFGYRLVIENHKFIQSGLDLPWFRFAINWGAFLLPKLTFRKAPMTFLWITHKSLHSSTLLPLDTHPSYAWIARPWAKLDTLGVYIVFIQDFTLQFQSGSNYPLVYSVCVIM